MQLVYRGITYVQNQVLTDSVKSELSSAIAGQYRGVPYLINNYKPSLANLPVALHYRGTYTDFRFWIDDFGLRHACVAGLLASPFVAGKNRNGITTKSIITQSKIQNLKSKI